MSQPVRARRFSFNTRQLFLVVALFAFVLGVWNWLFRWPSISISGPKLSNKQTIKIRSNGEYPYALSMHIFGNLDGTATITDPWERTTAVGPGNFDLHWRYDYYDDTAEIEYRPSTARTGVITVKYVFTD